MRSVAAELPAPIVACDPIPRLEAPSPAVFEREFARRGRPAVLAGLAARWPAVGRWSFDDLALRFPDAELMAAPTRSGRVDVSESEGLRLERLRLADCVDRLRSGDPACPYVSAPLEGLPEAFLREFERPAYCAGARWYRPKFWLGRAGTVTPLHWDIPRNLSVQVFGRKRWLLYPPGGWSKLYPCRPWSRSPNFSRVDAEKPDLARQPRFALVRPMGAVLEPGDALFIPPYWWHHVRSLEDNAAVSFWYGGAGMAAAGAVVHALKRARGLYPGEWG